MKKLMILAALLLPFTAFAQKSVSVVKNDSWIQYELVHPMHKSVGTSKQVTGAAKYDETNKKFQAVAVAAAVNTFDSSNGSRDSHMLEVVDAIKYPRIAFTSDSVEPKGRDEVTVKGKLTFHGVSKPISFTAKTWTQDGKVFVQGQTSVSLTALGVERPSFMMVPTEDALKITFRAAFK